MDNFHRPPVAKILPFCYNKVVNKGKESGNHGPRTADMDAKEIGRTISTHRKALRLTQMQLAAQLQVSNRTVSKWENGDGFPDISLLPGLAAALDITIDELLTGEVPAQIQQSVSAAEARRAQGRYQVPLRYNNDKQKKPLFSRGLSVCRLLFNSFSKLKIDENYKEKRRLFY